MLSIVVGMRLWLPMCLSLSECGSVVTRFWLLWHAPFLFSVVIPITKFGLMLNPVCTSVEAIVRSAFGIVSQASL